MIKQIYSFDVHVLTDVWLLEQTCIILNYEEVFSADVMSLTYCSVIEESSDDTLTYTKSIVILIICTCISTYTTVLNIIYWYMNDKSFLKFTL